MPNYHGAAPEQADADDILTAFAALAATGSPDGPEALALVERWRDHMARHHNGCDENKLRRLGELYGADDRFAEQFDSYGDGLAHFMAEAIEAYLESSPSPTQLC